MPTPRTEAYLFVHFIGEERTPTDEQLYFALSRDGAHWHDLRPAGKPALEWLGGEKGTRDPHIVRDPRGGFHLPSWRMGAKRWRDHQRFDWTGDLGLPRPNALERTTFGGRGVKDSGRGHGMGAGSELGSRSRAVDRILVHQVECP